MENITVTDSAHTKNFCKDFETKNLEEYHDLYVLEIYELDPAHFLSAPGLSGKQLLKRSK